MTDGAALARLLPALEAAAQAARADAARASGARLAAEVAERGCATDIATARAAATDEPPALRALAEPARQARARSQRHARAAEAAEARAAETRAQARLRVAVGRLEAARALLRHAARRAPL